MKTKLAQNKSRVQKKARSRNSRSDKARQKAAPEIPRRVLSDGEFNAVCETEYARAAAIVRSRGFRNDIDARPIVNEAMLSMRNTRVTSVEQFKKWLRRRVRCRAAGAYRARIRQGNLLEEYANELITAHQHPSLSYSRAELLEELEFLLPRLPEAEGQVFKLRRLEELTVKQAAHALGLPEGTVKNYCHRAEGKLRELMSGSVGAFAP